MKTKHSIALRIYFVVLVAGLFWATVRFAGFLDKCALDALCDNQTMLFFAVMAAVCFAGLVFSVYCALAVPRRP